MDRQTSQCHIYIAVHTSHTHSSRYSHMHTSTHTLNRVTEVSVLSMAMPLWVPSGKPRSRLHLWELWPGATEPVCTFGRPDWILLLCIVAIWTPSFFKKMFICSVSLFTTITPVTNAHLHRSHIPARSSGFYDTIISLWHGFFPPFS